jgi:hypothetical protein
MTEDISDKNVGVKELQAARGGEGSTFEDSPARGLQQSEVSTERIEAVYR